jgi:hypothetical protein
MTLNLICKAVETRSILQTVTLGGDIDGVPIEFSIGLANLKAHGKFRKGNAYGGTLTESVSPENKAIDDAAAKVAADAKAKADAKAAADAKASEAAEKTAFDKAVQAEVTRLLALKAAQAKVDAELQPA